MSEAPKTKKRKLLIALTILSILWLLTGSLASTFPEGRLIGYFEANSPPLVFIAPIFFFGGWCLLKKQWKWGCAAVAIGVIAMFGRGGFQWGRTSADRDLRVLSWNVMRGVKGFDQLKATILAANPDVMVLVDSDTESLNSELPAYLAANFPSYKFVREGQMGIGSRFPVISTQFVSSPEGLRTRPFLECVLNVNNKPLRVIAAHLSRPRLTGLLKWDFSDVRNSYRKHRAQVTRLLEFADSNQTPTLLSGDFNMTPRTEDYDRIATKFKDSFAEAGKGCGWSFPQPIEGMRLDYIWARGLTPVNTEFSGHGASDHLAFIADFKL
ncbi:MAG: endonuclease/exonuclease/phosphatase family protein [Fimbriimonadaceae bacterium]